MAKSIIFRYKTPSSDIVETKIFDNYDEADAWIKEMEKATKIQILEMTINR